MTFFATLKHGWWNVPSLKRFLDSDQIMIVAHPDDEVFWGGATLASGNSWGVICMTHAKTASRKKSFLCAARTLGAAPLIFDIPDRRTNLVSDADKRLMTQILNPLINRPRVSKVVTHSPDGETGHQFHKALSSVVESICLPDRLHFLNFDDNHDLEITRPELWSKKVKALACYFPDPEDVPGNDALHIALSHFEHPIQATYYRTPSRLLRTIYAGSSVPNGTIKDSP